MQPRAATKVYVLGADVAGDAAALADVAAAGLPVRAVLNVARARQGLTLVHFSAQLEPCLTRKNTLLVHTLNTPYHPLNMGYTTPTRTPYPTKRSS